MKEIAAFGLQSGIGIPPAAIAFFLNHAAYASGTT
jgi:hypothetical protein